MRKLRPVVAAAALLALAAPTLQAQAAAPAGARAELLGQFEASMQKLVALAEAMPADKFAWSPGEGVMPVGHVFAHVAHYNFAYPVENMGVAKPADVGLDTLENVRSKAAVVALLRRSGDFVRTSVTAMPEAELAQPTTLYGRQTQEWAVLLQLVAHMNEHLGQSIAYARMNGVVPPWSR